MFHLINRFNFRGSLNVFCWLFYYSDQLFSLCVIIRLDTVERVHASSIAVFNKILDKYLVRAGYT